MLKLASSFTHDVADVASMEVLKNRLAIAVEFLPGPALFLARKDSGILLASNQSLPLLTWRGSDWFEASILYRLGTMVFSLSIVLIIQVITKR